MLLSACPEILEKLSAFTGLHETGSKLGERSLEQGIYVKPSNWTAEISSLTLSVTLTHLCHWRISFCFLTHLVLPVSLRRAIYPSFCSFYPCVYSTRKATWENLVHDGSRGHTHHSALADICSLSVEQGNTIRLLRAIHHPPLWLRAR